MLAEDIIRKHATRRDARAGEIVEVSVDRIYAQDGNAPTIRRLFKQYDLGRVFDPSRVHFVSDHSVLAPDRAMATRIKEAERFAIEAGIDVAPIGEGISHIIAAERGWFKAGEIVLGADSHTCTGGAYQALALGMGASDIVAAMVRGKTWLRIPKTVRIEIVGRPGPGAGAKDVILHILSMFDATAFLYKSIEWCGPWVEQCSADEAATVANMAVELGAKCSFLSRWRGAPAELQTIVPGDGDGAEAVQINIEGLAPQFADGNSISSSRAIGASPGSPVNYVFLGSCANSRLSDLEVAATILKGRSVARRCRLVVTPGSRAIFLQALRMGFIETLTEAGALVTPPGCGACVGTQGHVPADGDVVLSTMNRNFLGRMGNPSAEIIIASPVVAAATALLGHIPSQSDLLGLLPVDVAASGAVAEEAA